MNCHGKWNLVRVTALLVARCIAVVGLVAYVTDGGRAGADEKVGLPPQPVNPALAGEEKAIRQTAEAFMKAFNAGDARAVAALWTADGDYVDEHGEVFRGRDAIEKMYATLFAHARGVKIEITIDSIRFLGKETALEKGMASARPAGGKATATRFTAVQVKREGKWLMESVHESPCNTGSNYEHLRDLEWFIGTWTANPGGVTIEMKCEWTANRNFILCTRAVKKGDGMVGTSTQVIGWDPTRGQIRSWD